MDVALILDLLAAISVSSGTAISGIRDYKRVAGYVAIMPLAIFAIDSLSALSNPNFPALFVSSLIKVIFALIAAEVTGYITHSIVNGLISLIRPNYNRRRTWRRRW